MKYTIESRFVYMVTARAGWSEQVAACSINDAIRIFHRCWPDANVQSIEQQAGTIYVEVWQYYEEESQ